MRRLLRLAAPLLAVCLQSALDARGAPEGRESLSP